MITSRAKEIANEMLAQERLGNPVTQDAIAQIFHDRDGQAFSNSTYVSAKELYTKLRVSPYFSDEDMLMRAGSAALMEMMRYLPLADSYRELSEMLHDATAKNIQYEQAIVDFNSESEEVIKKLSVAISQLEKNPSGAGLVDLMKKTRILLERVSSF